MMTNKFLVSLFVVFIVSCGSDGRQSDVTTKRKATTQETLFVDLPEVTEAALKKINLAKWYVYSGGNSSNHLVLSKQDVYLYQLTQKEMAFKFQILSYYKTINGKDEPGYFSIRVANNKDNRVKTIEVRLKPCELAPDECAKLTKYLLLNLETAEWEELSDPKEAENYEWHLKIDGSRGTLLSSNNKEGTLSGLYRHPEIMIKEGLKKNTIDFSSLNKIYQDVVDSKYFLKRFQTIAFPKRSSE